MDKDVDACHPANAANVFDGQAWSSVPAAAGEHQERNACFEGDVETRAVSVIAVFSGTVPKRLLKGGAGRFPSAPFFQESRTPFASSEF